MRVVEATLRAHGRAAARDRARRGRHGARPERDLPAADRPAPGGRARRRGEAIATLDGWTAYDALSDPELAGALVDLVRDAGARAQRRLRRSTSSRVGGPGRRPGAGLGRAARRSARVTSNTLGRDRRGARAQGLPAAHRRATTRRSSCCASSREHGFENTPELLGSYEHSGPPDRLDARHRDPLRAGRARRLVVRALVAGRAIPRASSARSSGWARSSARCTSCSPPTPAIPSFARRGAERRVARARRGHARRGDRGGLRAPARERGAGADRGPRRGGARAPARAREHDQPQPRDPHPRQPPPRRPALDGLRLARARLRGPARAQRARSAAASARRCATSPACCARSPMPRRRRCSPAAARRPRAGRSRRARTSCAATSPSSEPSGFVPGGAAGAEQLLEIFELEKAVDELRHELEVRPGLGLDPRRRDRAPARPAARRVVLARGGRQGLRDRARRR